MPVYRWKPSEKEREAAQTMAAYGVPVSQIARILAVSEELLHERLGKDMEDYKVKANARVAATLYQMAVSGTMPSATYFWLKTRAGWRETDRLEIEQRSVNVNVNQDLPPAKDLKASIRILIQNGVLKPEEIMPDGYTVLPPVQHGTLELGTAQTNGHHAES